MSQASYRDILILTVLLGLIWIFHQDLVATVLGRHFSTMSQPKQEQQQKQPIVKDPDSVADLASARVFTPLTLLSSPLSAAQLPSASLPDHRVIVVGDVHGMLAPLRALLDQIGFDGGARDHLILAGDLVSKGPNSGGVVDFARAVGASGVRGNHEDKILRTVGKRALRLDEAGGNEDGLGFEDKAVLAGPDVLKCKKTEEGKKAKHDHCDGLTRSQLRWIVELPLVLNLGHLDGMGGVVVVHAGLVPSVPLEKQDPWAVMNIRSFVRPDASTASDGDHTDPSPPFEADGSRLTAFDQHVEARIPDDSHDGKRWSDAWNEYQKQLPKKDRTTVIYGHDAKRGLCLDDYSMGIDTGCVKGKKLTGVVIEWSVKKASVTHRLVQVECDKNE